MTNKQYKNIIQMTLLNKENTTGKEDVEVLKKIFDNCGVPFPTGTKEEVRTALKSGTYVGWSPCSAAEAQAAANEGIASIGISNEKAYVVEPEVTETLSISTEINSVYSVDTATLSDEERDSTEYFAQAKFEYDANGNISVMATGTTTEIFRNSWRIDSSVRDQAISKMNSYYRDNHVIETHIDREGTCVFAFEGLGLGTQGSSATVNPNYHAISGYLNAMMVVTEGREIKYVTREASTLPDARPNNSPGLGITTLVEGVYDYKTGYHNGYAALVPTFVNTPGWYIDPTLGFYTESSSWVNIHASGINPKNGDSANSKGCQTVRVNDYFNFGKAVGFLDSSCNPNSIPTSDISDNLSTIIGEENGYTRTKNIKYILNRDYDNKNSDLIQSGAFYPENHTCNEKCRYC